MNLEDHIASVPDFPKKGVVFKDVSPLFLDAKAFGELISELAEMLGPYGANKIVAAEARGFMFGTPLALKLGIAFVPVRKKGKLPRRVTSVNYDLEYGSDTLCVHTDDISASDRIIVFDDILATGGTAEAMCRLVEGLGATVAACAFVMELGFLKGREKLMPRNTVSYLVD